MTTEYIWGNGIIFVNDHSNFHFNVTKIIGGNTGPKDNYYHDYSIAFLKVSESTGFYNNYYNYQLIMINRSSNAIYYINGTVVYANYYDFVTFPNQDSNNAIVWAFELTDHNSNSISNNLDIWVQYDISYFKLP